jgi:hypothetical protein
MKDDCGVNSEANGFYTDETGTVDWFLGLNNGIETDGTWTGSAANNSLKVSTVHVHVWANDQASNANKGTKAFNVTCHS